MIYISFEKKIIDLKSIFEKHEDSQDIYIQIIELGQSIPLLPEEHRVHTNRVEGCQSISYIDASFDQGKMCFRGFSDALISRGLMALMIFAYNGEPPEVILKCEPTFLRDLRILSSISLSRANGLMSMHLKMKQQALLSYAKALKPND
ncbi:MAG: SufE family protein [Simkaniaceae bacterium]|nr:SufE family protein [Simkaniaceae bacterium]